MLKGFILSLQQAIHDLKKLSDTRWSCRVEAVEAIYNTYPALLQALEEIEASDCNAITASEANGLYDKITKFEFLLSTTIWEKVLNTINVLSKYLQSSSIDVTTAAALICSTVRSIKNTRNEPPVFKRLRNLQQSMIYLQYLQSNVLDVERRCLERKHVISL